MESFNLYYLDLGKMNSRICERWDKNEDALHRRSKKDRAFIVGISGFDANNVRIIYHYDVDSSWPYRSLVDLEIKDSIPFSHPEMVEMLVRKTQNLVDEGEIEWMTLNGNKNCLCRYVKEDSIVSLDEFTRVLLRMMGIFDPLFKEYLKERKEEVQFLAYSKTGKKFDSKAALRDGKELDFEVLKVRDLDFSVLKIPDYQRTYKWTRRNVNQFLNDILLVKSGSHYRLGTLVVNNGDIVDGQQRTITIALLLSQLFRNANIKRLINEDTRYRNLYESVIGFWNNTHYKSHTAISNIYRNLDFIKGRSNDLGLDFFRRFVDDCEFVVVYLKSQNEAFQFFDSQNSRGKDLSPHDLLKAFHLREIPTMTEYDKYNITYWQKMKTEDLESLFLTMYRIKRWSKSLSAREFTKDDIGVFKGFSPMNELNKSKPSLPLFGPAFYLCRCFAAASHEEFPFQLDGSIVNGSLFFDMIRHYDHSRVSLYSADSLKGHPETQEIITLLGSYDKRGRIGDTYVRSLFDALMIYYADKFGAEYLDSVSAMFFLYAYRIRLENSKVSISTVDNEAVTGPLFRAIRDASGPLDILSEEVPAVVPDQNCSKALKEKFNSLNKIR